MTSPQRAPEPLRCRTYTFARRYPLVIGKIGGWHPWWGPMTIAQYAVLTGSALLLLQTRAAWAHLPGPANLLAGLLVPFVLAWLARHVRVEGRSPIRAATGMLSYLIAPRRGLCQGRAVRATRPMQLGNVAIPIADLPETE